MCAHWIIYGRYFVTVFICRKAFGIFKVLAYDLFYICLLDINYIDMGHQIIKSFFTGINPGIIIEPHHEKTGFLPRRKQRRRSASQ